MRLADLLVEILNSAYNVDTVFTVTGGGAMYLNDAFGKLAGMNYVSMHHEQSVSMAAESFSRIGNRLGVCQITTGPGGTNAISGCAGAWIDSCPILFISGQVESFSISRKGARQTGVQEVDIISLVKPITKEAVQLTDPKMVLYELQRLIHISTNGRPGPVWLDIPLDVQNHHLEDVKNLPKYQMAVDSPRQINLLRNKVNKFLPRLYSAKRPLLLVGNGCRSEASRIIDLAKKCSLPIVTGWNAKDLIPHSEPLLLGSAGQFGNREANLAVSRADLLIGIGYRFSIPQIGYDPSTYAADAEIVSIEIDPAEITKYAGFIDIGIQATCKQFLDFLDENLDTEKVAQNIVRWANQVTGLKNFEFDVGPRSQKSIDSFDFTDELSTSLPANSVVITDMGTSFTCSHQSLKIKAGMRLMTSAGLAAMGFGLPGAIGASLAKPEATTTLITGDGGLMFNLQELQTIVTHKLPIKIIIYENDGYLTMKLMQKGRFQRYVASNKDTGIECANFAKISEAFGIKFKEISSPTETKEALDWLYAEPMQPAVLIVHIEPMQELTPRVQTSSTSDGKLIPGTLDNMYPYLDESTKERLTRHFEQ